jgi:hypothetical protein
MPTNDCPDVVILLKEYGLFPVEIQQECVEKLVIFGKIEPPYDGVERRILEVIF